MNDSWGHNGQGNGCSVIHCPITCGLPTRMTERGFAAACKAQRSRGEQDDATPMQTKSSAQTTNAMRKKLNICAACRGKSRPAGLEIITLEEGTNMARNIKTGICESCRNKGITVGQNYSIKMCSSCATTHAAVNNRLPVVIDAIKRIKVVDQVAKLLDLAVQSGDTMTVEELGEAIKAEVDSKTSTVLKRIADAVAYEGDDPEKLAAAVEQDSKNFFALIDKHAELNKQHVELIGQLDGLLAERNALSAADDKIRNALGVTDPSFDLLAVVSELTQTLDTYRNRCDELVAVLATKDEEEQRATEQLRAWEAAMVAPDDRLVDARMSQQKPMDSYLLDLALAMLDGRVTGVAPDFLATMREAV